MVNLDWRGARTAFVALLVSVLLVGCGSDNDGGTSTGNGSTTSVTRVISFGDSLSDVGTYQVPFVAGVGGGRFTTNPGVIWVEDIAARYGVAAPSPNIKGGMGTAVSLAGGTGYAQGGARVTAAQGIGCVNNGSGGCTTGGALTYPVTTQIASHLAANSGSFNGRELVLVLAGANDVFAQYIAVGNATIDAPTALANMQTVATELANLVKTQIIANGAARVVVLNLPDIGATPFGATQTPTGKALLTSLVQAFNSQLATSLSGSIAVQVDLHTQMNNLLAQPATYSIANTTNVACSASAIALLTGNLIQDGSSLFCSGNTGVTPSTTLVVAGADSTYLFADSVHPTTKGHQLIGEFAWSVLQPLNWQQ